MFNIEISLSEKTASVKFLYKCTDAKNDNRCAISTKNDFSVSKHSNILLLKAMLHEAIFLATCNATMTNKKKNSSCRGGVTRLQLFSQLATCSITNKMAEISREGMMSSDWPILKKVALQVAEGMLRGCSLSRNVAKSRGSFYFSCNSQRNNCSCKMGCYT